MSEKIHFDDLDQAREFLVGMGEQDVGRLLQACVEAGTQRSVVRRVELGLHRRADGAKVLGMLVDEMTRQRPVAAE